MQHINLSNYKGSITDWTELNYINGGLADNLANIANIKVNDSCYNYIAKSANLIKSNDVPETTESGITYKIENGIIYLISGTATVNKNVRVALLTLPAGTYYFKSFGVTGSNSTYFSYLQAGDLIRYSYNNRSFTLSEETQVSYYFAVRAGTSVSNLQFKDMLVSGSTAPIAYEPYGALVIHQNAREVVVNRNSSYLWISGTYKYATLNVDGLFKLNGNISITGNDNIVSGIYASNGNIMFEFETAYSSADELKLAMEGVIVKFELATPQIIVLKSVDLGTLSYTSSISSGRYLYKTTINDIKGQVNPNQNIVASSSVYNAVSTNKPWVDKDMAYSEMAIGSKSVTFVNNDYTTVAAFKTAMSGVILLYEPEE